MQTPANTPAHHTPKEPVMNTNTRQMLRIYDITDPWIHVSPDREPWTITLTSGQQVTIHCPLGAAVELEDKGYLIVAGYTA